jgi:hypothetical protein
VKKLTMKIVEKIQVNEIIFTVVDSGDLFTGEVITRSMILPHQIC